MIFTSDRAAFLEFLRNLTPQILLLSVALIMTRKLNLDEFDLSNLSGTMPFILVLCTFFAAVSANTFLFLERSFESSGQLDRASRNLHRQGIHGARHLFIIAQLAFRRRKQLFFEAIVVVLVAQVGFAAVVLSGIFGATNFELVLRTNG